MLSADTAGSAETEVGSSSGEAASLPFPARLIESPSRARAGRQDVSLRAKDLPMDAEWRRQQWHMASSGVYRCLLRRIECSGTDRHGREEVFLESGLVTGWFSEWGKPDLARSHFFDFSLGEERARACEAQLQHLQGAEPSSLDALRNAASCCTARPNTPRFLELASLDAECTFHFYIHVYSIYIYICIKRYYTYIYIVIYIYMYKYNYTYIYN